MNEDEIRILIPADHSDIHCLSTSQYQPVISNGSRLSNQSWFAYSRSRAALAQIYEDTLTWDLPLELYAGLLPGFDNPRSAQPWEDRTRSLAIWPIDEYGFDYWAIGGAPVPVGDDPSRAIVFLFVRNFDGHCPEFTLQDSLFWIENDKLVAHANIDEVYQHDIIVNNEGLLVPVLAKLFPERLRPINIEGWAIEDHLVEYKNLLSDHHFPKPLRPSRKTLVNDKAICMPPIAVQMDSDLATNIHELLEQHLRTKE